MPEHNPGQMGGTMRLGKRRTIFKSSTSVLRMCPLQIQQCTENVCLSNSCIFDDWDFVLTGTLYGNVEYVEERHRHRFEVEAKHLLSWEDSNWFYWIIHVYSQVSPWGLILQLAWNALLSIQVNPELKHHFEEKGLQFVGQDVEGERMEVIELEGEWKVLLTISIHAALLINISCLLNMLSFKWFCCDVRRKNNSPTRWL